MIDGNTEPTFLAIDGGTESIRAALVNMHGAVLSQATSAYPTSFPESGHATQRVCDWEKSLVIAINKCISKASTGRARIAAVCSDATTCTLLPIDSTGVALSDALMWMDVRASDQALRIHSTGHYALLYCPSGLVAEWMLPKVLWMKEMAPELYRSTRYFIEYQDWLSHFFTGEITLNLNTITQRWLYNSDSWLWPTSLFDEIGLSDLAAKLPDRIVPPGSIVGEVSSRASQLTGVPVGTPVIQGGGDAPVGMLGLGAVEPGSVGLITGSSNVIAGFSKDHLNGEGIFGTFPNAVIPGLELIEAGQVSTGSVLAWFRNLVCGDVPAAQGYEVLEQEAATYAPGAGGVISLDSFQGNRTPFADSALRGALWGLSLSTTRGHIYRSLMESIAFGAALILNTFKEVGYPVHTLTACGGGTKSPLLMQMYADICGMPVHTVQVQDAPLLGCAILAAWGTGMYSSINDAVASMVHPAGVIEPSTERHKVYERFYGLYVDSYQALRDLMHRL